MSKRMVGTPQWYSLYCSAMLERDRSKASFQITSAEKAIEERVAELQVRPAAHGREKQDLNHAYQHLRILHRQIGRESEDVLWD